MRSTPPSASTITCPHPSRSYCATTGSSRGRNTTKTKLLSDEGGVKNLTGLTVLKCGEAHMNILVIPDVHLKDWMFRRASEIMKERNIEKAVCLMDIPDDWGQERSVSSYESCYDAAIAFAKQYPKTLWCCGNHDLSYIWAKPESGYSIYAAMTVKAKLKALKEALNNEFRLAYVHRIDNVLFSHGGVTQEFVRSHLPGRESRDTDVTIDTTLSDTLLTISATEPSIKFAELPSVPELPRNVIGVEAFS